MRYPEYKPDIPLIKSLEPYGYALIRPYLVDINHPFFRWPKFYVPVSFPSGRYFVSDLASIPKFMRLIASRYDLGLIAPIVHDYLCEVKGVITTENNREIKLSSEQAHRMFYDLMYLDGSIPGWKAWCCYKAVQWFGPKF